MTVREVVLGYTGEKPPTPDEVSAARMWMDATGSTESVQGRMGRADWAACCNLLQASWRWRGSQMNLPTRTDPRVRSAPLPKGTVVGLPDAQEITAEIQRASTELMWALHRQRTTWTRMEALKAEAEGKGNAWFMDNDRRWKLATGDVGWWRGEVSSRANALSALLALASAMGVQIGRLE